MKLDSLIIKHQYEMNDEAKDPATGHFMASIRCVDCDHTEYSEYQATRDEAMLQANSRVKMHCVAKMILKTGMVDFVTKLLKSNKP